MRVIAGEAKGRRLKSVPGDSTRPILDRIKENLFNIIGMENVRGTHWLDLFAGTGGVGIEALSRGCDYCLFIDSSREAIRTVEHNLRLTELADRADVLRDNAFVYLKRQPDDDEGFDYIFIAPPQYKNMWEKALRSLDQKPEWLVPNGVAVVQIDPQEYEEFELAHLTLYDKRIYGNTMLCFYERE